MADIKENKQPRDNNGKPHGEWFRYYDNGQLDYYANFVHGIRNGVTMEYYEDGTLVYYRDYNMGKKIRYWYDIYEVKTYHLCII